MNLAHLRLAAGVAVGQRPSRGPYTLTIQGGSRWEASGEEYTVYVSLDEHTEDGGQINIFQADVPRKQWDAAIRAALSVPGG